MIALVEIHPSAKICFELLLKSFSIIFMIILVIGGGRYTGFVTITGYVWPQHRFCDTVITVMIHACFGLAHTRRHTNTGCLWLRTSYHRSVPFSWGTFDFHFHALVNRFEQLHSSAVLLNCCVSYVCGVHTEHCRCGAATACPQRIIFTVYFLLRTAEKIGDPPSRAAHGPAFGFFKDVKLFLM